jgi:lipoprotein-releasing system ATP-binding protein
MIPALKLARLSRAEIEQRAMEKLRIFDMQDHAKKKPNQLLGEQKQRVSIARALINDPLLIMGDEPTGNLDHKNVALVFDKFKELTQELGQTLLIVTHDQEFAKATDRTIEMERWWKKVKKISSCEFRMEVFLK